MRSGVALGSGVAVMQTMLLPAVFMKVKAVSGVFARLRRIKGRALGMAFYIDEG